MKYEYICSEDVEHFTKYGFLNVPGALDESFCKLEAARAFTRLGFCLNGERREQEKERLDG